ncbi:hypothetical protein CRT60_06585 [Azospirillum palustre]|uniref:Uncharacterized protein n=2 Tax=Azospirillum TaxID=191 RepID=A0A2B8BIF0_9PROT|nr:hypothetical protein [Azospirillum palustre]PGH57655.1 hypothetical protein CRT60_06585 [Azospirillum palustre]
MSYHGAIILQMYRCTADASELMRDEPVICRNETDAWSRIERMMARPRYRGAHILRTNANGTPVEILARIGQVLPISNLPDL